jgi:DNA polymerase-3 subunit delta
MLGRVTDQPWDDEAADSAVPAPAAVTLVLGPEEFLAERAVARITAHTREIDPEVEVRRLAGPDLQPGELTDLTAPSLFGETTLLILDRANELVSEQAAEVATLVRFPVEHVRLVILHAGQANRAKAVLDACRDAHAATIDAPKISKISERLDFVKSEARTAGRRMADDAARTLVDAVGSDLRELAAAVSQLVSDTDGAITSEVVTTYYAGRADVTSFQVADLAVDGRTADALGQLRHALGSGVAPVLVTSALASALRSIGRVASAPRGTRPADLARDLGMPPWKVDVVRRQVKGWSAEGLSDAVAAVAQADAAVKGANGAGDPAYALEKVVVQIGRARALTGA